MVSGYTPDEFPDWTDRPWEFPGILWRLPYWPVRLYLHAGDRVLFEVWWRSRRAVWWLSDRLGPVE